jgi:hypothetical protein
MRGKPVHADPTVRPASSGAHSLASRWQTQVNGTVPAPASAASASALGVELPQVTVDHKVAQHIKSQVSKRREELLKSEPALDRAGEEQRCLDWINEAVALWSSAAAANTGVSPTAAEDDALRRAVYDLLFRAGRLQPYLDDPRVEDIFINGPADVWLDYADGQRRRVGPIADSEEELLELLRELARESGHSERTICRWPTDPGCRRSRRCRRRRMR